MATQLKKVVAPSGGDYTSLEACMNANEQDLVSADQYFDVEISGDWSGGADTTIVTVENYTLDATRYINIYTTGSARHNGTALSSAYYSLDPSTYCAANSPVIGAPAFCTIDGIIVKDFYSHWGNSYNYGITTAGVVKNCIVCNGRDANHSRGIRLYTGAYAYNNIVYDCAIGICNLEDYVNKCYAYNNTCYNCVIGLFFSCASTDDDDKDISRNNLCIGNGTDFGYGTTGVHSNDGSSDATGDVQDLTTSEFVSVTADSEDLHLASGASSIGAGTDLSGTFTTDIDGDTRVSWDIGADEYSSGTPPATTGFMTCMKGYW